MAEWLPRGAAALLGLSGGLAVGSGLIALLVILDLIPRLAQLSRGYRQAAWFETAVLSGTVFWMLADFGDWRSPQTGAGHLLVALAGLFSGLFVGMLAAALTEVINVLPIMARRLRLEADMPALIWALVLGKMAGSLFDWFVYQR
ncbi:MAG: stage V sporulation protein AB [Thermobacillus sp. ZCTH02-B1]|uniref:stage V sporulation protein AB n=1 Tax=Thermobacillus sp. ZCTH02-B1 TaxID=1858795 RepID=UPI000B54E768|nr:stage V sporulation protein AB [Thermobacillus sp. ZCTH02-B1]OUM96831.1 MAG: stage V sporulation protein AB [Thermobacillus sp. ZCTH02-B1]